MILPFVDNVRGKVFKLNLLNFRNVLYLFSFYICWKSIIVNQLAMQKFFMKLKTGHAYKKEGNDEL